MLYLNLEMYQEGEDGSLVWAPTFLRCLDQAMNETRKPGHPPGCLHRVAVALLAMEEPLERAREYVGQAYPEAPEALANVKLADAILRYGQMKRPDWSKAREGE